MFFRNSKGKYYSSTTLREQFTRLLQDASLPAIRFHDLRHSAATILLTMGINPKLIQERLGHSDVRITLGIYGHVTASMQDQAMQALDIQFHHPASEQQ